MKPLAKSRNFGKTAKDVRVAATAISLQIPLVTNNKKHFQKINGLTIISEK
jgi:predicted nucleic acid-binding protein